IRLTGSVPIDTPPEMLGVALEDPALYAATFLTESLRRHGALVDRPPATASDARAPGWRVLAGHDSATVAEIVRGVNKPSHNLHAEVLLRHLGTKGGDGSAAAGLQALGDFLRRLDVPTDGFELVDGCGLARSALVTPHGMAAFLAAAAKQPWAD